MNTLIKMFSLCLCSVALVFSAPDSKLNDNTNINKLMGNSDGPISLKTNPYVSSGDTRECEAGYVDDCSGDGDCCPESWIGDGFEDCEDQAFGCDLTCYENDGGDCDGSTTTGGTTGGGSEACEDCEFDFTPYGSECCDTAWYEFGVDCATLESNYSWDCAGCSCPGDIPCEDQGLIECWDGSCAASEDDCPEFGTCPDGQVVDCDGSGECWPETWIGDGLCDGEDQAWNADLTCYDCDGGDCPASDPGCTSCEDTGLVTCWDFSCADSADDCPEAPDVGTPGICVEGLGLDYYGTGDYQPAVMVTWDFVTVCGDGSCQGDEDYYNCPDDCNAPGDCTDVVDPQYGATVPDCSGDGDCCPEAWIGDGFCDDELQEWGCDLMCYDEDGGDCGGRGSSDASTDEDSNISDYLAKKNARSLPSIATSMHDASENTSSREVVFSLTFEVIEGANAGFAQTWDLADASLGEFTVFGFSADDFTCVTAQACDAGACGDPVGPVCVLAGADDGLQECAEGAGGDPCAGTVLGDASGDGFVNVLDIVQIVSHILGTVPLTDCALVAADYTQDEDGSVNVLDIVQIVAQVLGDPRITGDASEAVLKNTNGQITLDADGYVGGVQMTLSHDSDFSINMTDKALVADYNTMGNITKLVVVAPESNELFSSTGRFTIDEVMVANSSSEISIGLPSSIELIGAYPNPFNPSTTLSLRVDSNSAVTIMAYDIAGHMVDVVFDGSVNAGISNITWNASSLPSGVYFVKVNTPNGSSSMQKVMLMK